MTANDGELIGGCRCGRVRYSSSGAIIARRICWCRDCQYLSCGSASVSVIVERKGLDVVGVLAEFRSQADSGSHMVRSFCPYCGTSILSAADENPNYIVIRGGTLDDPELAKPDSAIWIDSAPSWALVDPAMPTAARQPGALEQK